MLKPLIFRMVIYKGKRIHFSDLNEKQQRMYKFNVRRHKHILRLREQGMARRFIMKRLRLSIAQYRRLLDLKF